MTTTDPFERAVLKAIQESMDGGEGAEPLRAPDLDDLSDGELEGLMCNADQGCCENAVGG